MKAKVILFILGMILLAVPVFANEGLNLTAYWSINNSNRSGNDVYDLVGNGYNFTNSGGTLGGAGFLGQDISCDGINDYASHTEITFTTTMNRTWAGWVYVDTGCNSAGEMIWTQGTGGASGVRCYDDGGTDKIRAQFQDIVGWKGAETTISEGVWRHIAWTWNGTHLNLYVNGTLEDSTATENTGNSQTWGNAEFCRDAYDDNQHFSGDIDEVGIWKRALTQAEIQSIYNSGAGKRYEDIIKGGSTPTITETYNANATENTTTEIKILFENYNITNSTNATLNYNSTAYPGTINHVNNSYVEFSANASVPRVYLNNTNLSFNWSYNLVYANATTSSGTSTTHTQAVYWNLTETPRVKINATDLTTGSAITSFQITDGAKSISTTTGDVYLWESSAGVYEVTINNTVYELKSANITFTAGVYGNYTFQLYTTNSIQIYIKDEETGLNITDNVSIKFTSNSSEFTNYTITAGLYVDGLAPGTWSLLAGVENNTAYSSRIYTVTMNNRSSQTLYIYLATNTSTTTFTVSDKDTAYLLENVLVTMYRMINGSWVAVESRYTDVTGKAQLSYQDSVNYKFFLAKATYDDYVFYLNPVLYSEYSIQMERTSVYNGSQDLDKIAVIYAPKSFTDGANSFNWIIQSPYGVLLGYGYTLTYPGGSNTTSGSNAIGGQLGVNFNISGANLWDMVTLDYWYQTSLAGNRSFRVLFPIDLSTVGNNTIAKNKTETYGLGLFERVFIATLIVLFVVGIASIIGQPVPGVALGLFVYGYLVYNGFVPFWSVAITMIVSVFFLTWEAG